MIPDGWKLVKIEGLCTKIVDCVNKTAPTVDVKTQFKMLRTTNIRNGKVDIENVRHVDEETFRKWTRRESLTQGDIILTREAPVGEVGILDVVGSFFLGQRTMMYRADPIKCNNVFMLYSLQTAFCKKQIEDFSNGGTVAHMRVPDCGKIILRVPPLPEQKKIAEILSTWDRAIEITEKLIANSQAQKKALMQQLLTGKKRLPGFKGEWGKKKLKDIIDIEYGASPKGIEVSNGIYPIIGTGGVVGWTNKYIFNKTSIVIGRKGTINRPKLITVPFWPIDTTFYCILKPNNDVFWLHAKLQSLNYRKYNEASGVPSLSRETLYSVNLDSPSLNEQQAIGNLIGDSSLKIESLTRICKKLKKEKSALMQQLLTGKRRVKVDEEEVVTI